MLTMSRKQWILRIFKSTFGLILFGFGSYLTIRANIGLAPWDVFCMGLSYHLPLTYGMTSVLISLIVVALDLILREKIGISTVLDALIVGPSVDFFLWLDLVPDLSSIPIGLGVMTIGLFLMAYAQYLYMSVGLGCGPRDTLLIALGKRLQKAPIGIVEILITAVVLGIGWLLGGPVGIGTIWSVIGVGAAMQLVFHWISFEPRDIIHHGLGRRSKVILEE